MNYEHLKKIWLEEEQHAFHGWDFSHLDSRWWHEPLKWDYKDIVMEYLHPTHNLLDMGTGGGEFLLSLGHPMRTHQLQKHGHQIFSCAWKSLHRLVSKSIRYRTVHLCRLQTIALT